MNEEESKLYNMCMDSGWEEVPISGGPEGYQKWLKHFSEAKTIVSIIDRTCEYPFVGVIDINSKDLSGDVYEVLSNGHTSFLHMSNIENIRFLG